MTRFEISSLVAKLLIIELAAILFFILLCTSTIMERQQQILTQQQLLLESIRGINSNLNNLGIHYKVIVKEKK